MKFAFCLFKYFPSGGLQRGFLQLAEVCLARGHEVDVYTGSWTGQKPDKLQIIIVPNKGLANHHRYESFGRRLKKIITGKGYDAVVGFNKMPGLDVYFASDICFAATAFERSFLYRWSGRCKALLRLERSVFDKMSRTQIILISGKEKKNYMDYYGTDEARFHLVPPGISLDRLATPDAGQLRKDFRHEFSINDDQSVVLMVGSNYKLKGVDRAITALSALPSGLKSKTLLMIVGKGKPAPYVRQAKRLGVLPNVRFAGERGDVPRFLIGADLLLHPAYHENTGTVLIEAMAAGLPVLATDICGYGFHIDLAGAGRLIPSPFKQETLNGMLLFMLTSEKKGEWGCNGKKYIEETDVFSRHEKAADVIEKVVAC